MRNLFIFLTVIFAGLYFDTFNIFRYCILSSFWHEIGHIIAYKILMKKWPEIKISVFGFTMENDIPYSDKLPLILVAGPFVNFLLCLLSSAMLNNSFKVNYFVFLTVNMIILIFNLLPVYYLDGGQILYIKSNFYQKNYINISIFTVILISVMVIYFTGAFVSVLLFSAYFIINLLNDI